MAPPESSPAAAAPNPASGRGRVLIVEDNPLNLKLFSAMIASQGYEVLQASDGHQGLAMARQQHPDVIVMDVQLPDMSGIEVAHILKTDEATSAIQIIATTAFELNDDEAKNLQSRCDAYMAKPIAISEFLELIHTLMARSRRAVRSQV